MDAFSLVVGRRTFSPRSKVKHNTKFWCVLTIAENGTTHKSGERKKRKKEREEELLILFTDSSVNFCVACGSSSCSTSECQREHSLNFSPIPISIFSLCTPFASFFSPSQNGTHATSHRSLILVPLYPINYLFWIHYSIEFP